MSPGPTASLGRLELNGLSRTFDGHRAVDDVHLTLEPGSFTALLGPSGCGKSTLLAMVAGLQRPDGGSVSLDGAELDDVPVERRPVGTVFQKPLLFPHLSVEGNVGFGLRAHGVGRRQARDAVAAMLERVQLAGLADRRVGELSGGQEQRVALARALVLSPRVLLLDEPFSQLDSALRSQMRSLVRSLVDEAGVTTLFVTHDQAEAVEVADQIALLLDGRLVGHTAPQQFWTRPPSLDAARFFGVTNELRGVVSSGRFTAAGLRPVPTDAPNGSAVLVVRPESLRLDESAASDLRVVGTVQSARFAGTHVAVDVSLGDDRLLVVHVPLATPVVPGARVTVTAAAAACTVLAEP